MTTKIDQAILAFDLDILTLIADHVCELPIK
jgi:hypothetical protein